MRKTLRLLLVEDSRDDAMLLTRELRRAGYDLAFERVETAEEMNTALDCQSWDVIVADYVLPHFGALEALALAKSQEIDLPFIVVSGVMGEETAVAAMKAGAHDFITKERLARLVPAIEREIGDAKTRRDRRQAEKALEMSECRFRELFQNMSSGVAVYEAIDGGADFVIRDFNWAAELIGRVKREDVVGTRLTEVFPGVKAMGLLNVIRQVWQTGEPEYWPAAQYQDDRISSWLENYVYRLPTGEVVAVYDDVTEQKRADDALHNSEERYRSLFQTALDGIMVRDLAGNIKIVNTAMEHLTGYSSSDLRAMHISHLLTPASLKAMMQDQQELLEGESQDTRHRSELRLLRTDGSERIVEAVTSLLSPAGEDPIIQAIIRDVTEQRLAQEQLRAYVGRATDAQEEERKRIARELHDETIQYIANLGMEIDSLAARYERLDSEEIGRRLGQLRDKTDTIMDSTRRTTKDLRPPLLDELGLSSALQWLAEDLENQAGIRTCARVNGTEQRLASHDEMLLFRIAQEALNNVRKHSKASEASVTLEFGPHGTRLEVADNGCGFKLAGESASDPAHLQWLGLIGMRERARLLGGSVGVNSEPGKGTTITVDLSK